MPFKSRAQRRKFAELLVKGEITAETFEEWNRETGSAKLPEHVSTSKKSSSTRKRKSTRSKSTSTSRKTKKKGGKAVRR